MIQKNKKLATKIEQGELYFGSLSAFLTHAITGKVAMDHSIACRTMLTIGNYFYPNWEPFGSHFGANLEATGEHFGEQKLRRILERIFEEPRRVPQRLWGGKKEGFCCQRSSTPSSQQASAGGFHVLRTDRRAAGGRRTWDRRTGFL